LKDLLKREAVNVKVPVTCGMKTPCRGGAKILKAPFEKSRRKRRGKKKRTSNDESGREEKGAMSGELQGKKNREKG